SGTAPSTPMLLDADVRHSVAPSVACEAPPERRSLFKSKIGSLLYLAVQTRPDILFATCSLARCSLNPSVSDMTAVDRVLSFVAHTRDKGRRLHSGEGIKLYATVDASFGNHSDSKSHSGCTMHIGRDSASILTLSKKQTVTA